MIIGSIAIRMSADARPFIAEVQESADALDRVASSAERAQSAFAGLDLSRSRAAAPSPASGGGFDAAALGSQLDTLAARIRSSLDSALAPLGTFAATFGRQFSAVGGTLIETSKRVAMASRAIVSDSGSAYLRELGYYKGLNQGAEALNAKMAVVPAKEAQIAAQLGTVAQAAALATAGIDAMTGAIVLATNHLDRLAAKLTEVTHAGRGPQIKLFDPAELGDMERKAAASDRLVKKEPIVAVAGAVAQVGARVTAVDKLFEHVNETIGKQIGLVEKAKAAQADAPKAAPAPGAGRFGVPFKDALGPNTAHQVQTLFQDLRDTDAMSRKVRTSLAGLSAGGALNRTIQETSLLGSQFRMLHAPIRTATGLARGFGDTLSVGLGLAGIGFKAVQFGVGLLKSGVKGASDLNETVDKTGHVFGESAGLIVRAADEMTRSFGVSKREFIDGAVSLGRFGKAAGLSQDASAKLGIDLARLGTDLASLENIDTATALQRLSSGIAGETEVLRKHGALLSKERIEQEAVTRGWSKGSGELSEQTKVMARISLIFKDLEDAQGDLARTANTPANAMRRVHGELENLAVSVGKLMLPAASMALELASETIGRISVAFEASKSYIVDFGATVGTVFGEVALVVRNLPDFAAIALVELKDLGQNFIQVLAIVPENIGIIADYLATNWRKVLHDLYSSTRAMSENIDKNFIGLFRSIQDFFNGKGWSFNWTPLLDGFKATADQFPALLKPALVSSQAEIDAIAGRIAGREAGRKKAAVDAVKPALPDFDAADKDKDKDKKKKGRADKDVAALELGSVEAASAVAKFRNEGSDQQPAKATAKNTEEIAKAQRETLAYLKRALDNKDPVKLAIAKL